MTRGADAIERAIRSIPQETAAGSPRHSYRNFDPEEFDSILDDIDALDDQQAQVELLGNVRGKLGFIESGRFHDLLEAGSRFFTKLDRDERVVFTRRNPDLVEWFSVHQRADGLAPVDAEILALAGSLLTDAMTVTRTGVPERTFDRVLPEGYEPPPFERKQLDHETLVEDMMNRRRSYRNWTPGEFYEFVGRDFEISVGALLSLRVIEADPDLDRQEIVSMEGKRIGRALMERIEAGRFEPVLAEGWTQFAAFDPDEKVLFARRNPGLVEWIAVWAVLEEVMFDPEKELFPMSSVSLPLVGEAGSDLKETIRQRIRERAGVDR